MAKIKFGAMMTDARGKLGGQVFSKNRGGAYLRTKVTPVNPNSPAQAIVRNRLTQFSQGFRGLLQEEITAWNSAVQDFQSTDIFGDLKKPTGLNLYVKLNANIDQVSGVAITVPPNISDSANTPAVVTGASATVVGGGAVTVTYAPTPVPADNAFVIYATRPLSAGKNFVKNEFREVFVRDEADISPIVITTAYNAKFGAVATGQKVVFRIIPINKLSGIQGAPVEFSAIAS